MIFSNHLAVNTTEKIDIKKSLKPEKRYHPQPLHPPHPSETRANKKQQD